MKITQTKKHHPREINDFVEIRCCKLAYGVYIYIYTRKESLHEVQFFVRPGPLLKKLPTTQTSRLSNGSSARFLKIADLNGHTLVARK